MKKKKEFNILEAKMLAFFWTATVFFASAALMLMSAKWLWGLIFG